MERAIVVQAVVQARLIVIINRLGGDWLSTTPEEGAALRHLPDWAPDGRTPSVLGSTLTHTSLPPLSGSH
jgi:hypothetical protein